jgi:hypothetical protein
MDSIDIGKISERVAKFLICDSQIKNIVDVFVEEQVEIGDRVGITVSSDFIKTKKLESLERLIKIVTERGTGSILNQQSKVVQLQLKTTHPEKSLRSNHSEHSVQ